ncbi:galactose mutarotase [Drosophila mojavensis]|uniref:Aldose 1-epimerase n=1 Tax=Drosophila mojavensis TaxID=7230 RepID=B4KV45_DROMO|nr:galactose mutarotase [Drosophila mojavensis]XP_015018268.1 galactose mutarotase [Drosophila mojavensis]EDW19385.1 uncharacterized protein Dmoj_GI11552, isoform A [Drosophila mojavensis]KRG06616.1 uncharacterized protein Dmoj_GI11552, isoform B [Drosophila mojavensis]
MTVTITEEIFGLAKNPFTKVPEMVRRYTMTNQNKMSVSVIQLGAIIQSVCMPDAYDKIEDVCLGFDDIASYVNAKHAYIGGTLGRVANRVANGSYTVGETKYELTKNFMDTYQLHGGFVGFDSVIWEVARKSDIMGITFKHVSPDGHEGYPGNLTVTVTYWLDNQNRLGIRYEAFTDKTTPINLSNHAYFNLAGHNAGFKGLAEHTVEIASKRIIDTDDDQIPTGEFLDVDDTVFDMRIPVLIGDRLKQFDNRLIKGYDNCFVVNEGKEGVNLIGKLAHPPSGRALEIYSNQPGLQFYTANNLPDEEKGDAPMIGKECSHYRKHGSFCVETEKFPDAVNHQNHDFPSIFLNPNEKYNHEVIYKFVVEQSWKCCCNNK